MTETVNEPQTEVSPPPVEEFDRSEKSFIENKAKEYRMQGSSDEESIKLATEDCLKAREATLNANEKIWDEVTKKVGLSDFIDDQLRRALGTYKSNYEKRYPEQTIDFKLQLKTRKGIGGRLIAGAALELQFAINGVWKMWRNKEVQFQHIREINDTHRWKLSLYEAMLHDVIGWGITFCLQLDNYKNSNGAAQHTPE